MYSTDERSYGFGLALRSLNGFIFQVHCGIQINRKCKNHINFIFLLIRSDRNMELVHGPLTRSCIQPKSKILTSSRTETQNDEEEGRVIHSCPNAGRKSIAAPYFLCSILTSKRRAERQHHGLGREGRRWTKLSVCGRVRSGVLRHPPATSGQHLLASFTCFTLRPRLRYAPNLVSSSVYSVTLENSTWKILSVLVAVTCHL